MKMVKSLLLGSAAGLVAVAGAQAADLPVKAKAVEYVKVCSAYGAGFYYIPGTDTCLKIGGYVRFDTYINSVGTFNPNISSPTGTAFSGPGSLNVGYPFHDNDDPDYLARARGIISLDARTATDYGTLRSVVTFGGQWDSQGGPNAGAGGSFYFERAFIQFAGFTFGYTASFFDLGLNYMATTPYAGSNMWTTLAAYTAEFGNGFSATLSLEDAANRTTGVQYGMAQVNGATWNPVIGNPWGTNNPLNWSGATYYNAVGGQQAPDIVANLRLSQAWGTAQVSVAAHQVTTADVNNVGGIAAQNLPGMMGSSDTWGWAVGGGVEFKLPFLAAGDSLFVQAGYADGAVSYLGLSGTPQGRANGLGRIDLMNAVSGSYAPIADALLTPFGSLEKVSGWSIQGQFRHFWTPALRSAVYGGYVSLDDPDATTIASYVGRLAGAAGNGIFYAPSGLDLWQVGANTVWSPVKNLDIGAEVLYTKVDLNAPNQYVHRAGVGTFQNLLAGTSSDIWSGGVRVQRNF